MSDSKPLLPYSSLLEISIALKQKLLIRGRYFSIARFSSFLITLAFIISAFSVDSAWWWPAAACLALFIVFVVFHERLTYKQKFNNSYLEAVKHELEALDGNYSSFDGGPEFIDHQHIFATDLDIFGNNSLFQAVNRTTTIAGKQTLADWLLKPLSDKKLINLRQGAAAELASLADWRLRLRAHGMVASEGTKDLESLSAWLIAEPLFKARIFRFAGVIIPLASLVFTLLLIAGSISISLFLLYLIFPLGVVGFYTKAINQRHVMLSRKVALLDKYAVRFKMIENQDFSSEFLKNLNNELNSGKQAASKSIRKLGRITASLDTRLNLLAGLVLNIYLLWDIRQMIRLEKWKQINKECLPQWFSALSEAEAIASLGAFTCCNQGFVFPEIDPTVFAIKAREAGHPLIPIKIRVNNDISVTHRGHFNIVTGANMAGKSTYLRTVGVNMVLALAGAPVCAREFSCYPAPVYTSLRTTDSLSSQQSYFYAELLRLKEMIDRLGKGEELFILLDEILKGTNSADKQAGSKALLTQLIGLGAAGFIATHDLELGNLEKSFPNDVTNYSFEAEISGDELHFDYKLKPGIARNMNATFLMKKMGITI